MTNVLVIMIVVPLVVLTIVKLAILITDAQTVIGKLSIRKRSTQYIYIIQVKGAYPLLVKIGRTRDFVSRFRGYSTILPYGLKIWAIIPVKDCHRAERFLHLKFSKNRIALNKEGFLLDLQMLITIITLKNYIKRGKNVR